MDLPTLLIDGFGPVPLVRPRTVAELGDAVRRAAAAGQAIYPIGGQTALGLGKPPSKPGVAVDLRGLDQVIDFPARDMTVTVQAGISIARLQALLAPENLQLPIDVPEPEQATLGGALATNISGPRRLGYGTWRDYVIGVSAINDAGNEFKAGGRVVKNVAGYDLCKLLVGSLGTLGIITQVTLKLRPLPAASALVTVGSDAAGLAELLDRLHGSRTRPVSVELLNDLASAVVMGQAHLPTPEAPWTIIVGYEGNADAVNWQVQQLVKELGAGHSLDARVDAAAGPLWRSQAEWTGASKPCLSLKANLLSSGLARIAIEMDQLTPRSLVQAHAGSGIVWGHVHAMDLGAEQAVALPGRWRNLVHGAGGCVVVTRCPAAWKNIVDVWGPPPADAWLMRQVKAQFDPRGVFNPGRFVDGI